MRNVLLVVAGMIIMYILLKMLSKQTGSDSEAWLRIKDLLKTQQFGNVMKTNEFRELAKTNEFRSVIGTLAEDQLVSVSKTLVG